MDQDELYSSPEERRAYHEVIGKRPELIAIFEHAPERDDEASIAAAFPIYRSVEYVREHCPDCADSIAVRVTDEHRQKYAAAYALWQRQITSPKSLLNLIPTITKGAIASFHEAKIGFVEDLAAFTQPLPEHLEPFRTFARRFVAVVNGEKPRYRLEGGDIVPVEKAA